MKHKKALMAGSLFLAVGVLAACGDEKATAPAPEKTAEKTVEVEQPKPKTEGKTVEQPVEKETKETVAKPVAEKEEYKLPPVPTSKQMTEVMNTFDSYKEYQGKLAEVGVTEPVHTLKNQALAGDGVKEYTADIHFYKSSDGYFALYAQGDKILKDLPASIAQHVWTVDEAESYIKDKK